MRTILGSCTPRSDVLSGGRLEGQFAAHLADVFDGTADSTRHNPPLFFDNTSPTADAHLLTTEAREWMAP